MSWQEYLIRLEAYGQTVEDEQRHMYQSAWLHERVAPATNRKGNYEFKTFNDFYPEGNKARRTGKEEAFERLREVARRRRELKGG